MSRRLHPKKPILLKPQYYPSCLRKDPNLKNLIFDDWFNNEIATRLDNLAKVVSLSTKAGIPVPCLSSTLDYLNSYRTNRLPQNLVQAMRDCFGSHTYERIDREGSFHTEWMK